MQIRFVKNIQFSKILKAEGRMREFNFRKPNGRDEALTTVDVSDDRGHRIIFSMRRDEGHWRIVPQPLPHWVSQLEHQLDEIIEDELRNY